MAITTISSRKFEQDTSGAMKASSTRPVIITDKGKPAYGLLGIEEYQRISGQRRSCVDTVSVPGLADIDFDPPRLRDFARPADLS